MSRKAVKSIVAISFAILSAPAFAGGYQTNTNQSISFLRNPSQDAAFGISALYNNPANTVFLAPGFHMAIGIMNVHQDRDVTSTYTPFAFGANNKGETTKRFEGDADAPILPSLQFAYNTKNSKWSFSFAFGLVGGGGKCQYDDGLPSFESAVAGLSMVASTFSTKDLFGNTVYPFKKGYKFDTFMRGRSYQYGFQFGAAHKVTKNISIYGGVRLLYATNNYFGYVKNIQLLTSDNNFTTARRWITEQHEKLEEYKKLAPALTPQIDALHKEVDDKGYMLADMTENIGLNCNQAGWGITPIIGIDWKINDHWNLAAKFEFKTRLRLHNESFNENTEGHGLEKYNNDTNISEDIPSILTVGAMYSPIKCLRINGGFHYFWDKQATYDFIAYAPVSTANPIRYYYNAADAQVADAGNEFKTTATYTLAGTNLQAIATEAEKVKGFTVEANGDLDLMISSSNAQVGKTHDDYVNLLFRHILSKLNITFAKAEVLQNADVIVTEVKITGLDDSGDYVESTYDATADPKVSGWTSKSVDTDYALLYSDATGQELNDGTYEDDDNDPATADVFVKGDPYFFIESLVMPQVIAAADQVTLVAKYTIVSGSYSEDYTYKLDLYEIADLRKFYDAYNYYLNFTIEPDVIKFDATVTPWADQTAIAKTIR